MQKEYDPEKRGGGVSWALLSGAILALEFRQETLSNALARFRERNAATKAITTAAIGTTALHLLDLLPDRIDPFDRIYNCVADYVDKGAHIP